MFRYLRYASQTFALYYEKREREKKKEVKNQTCVSARNNIFMCPPTGYTGVCIDI